MADDDVASARGVHEGGDALRVVLTVGVEHDDRVGRRRRPEQQFDTGVHGTPLASVVAEANHLDALVRGDRLE